jgi:hypothetical protein
VTLRVSYAGPGYGSAMLPVMVADMGCARRPWRDGPIDLLAGHKLEFVRLGNAVVLSFTGGRQVLIESRARLDGPDGPVDIEPGERPSDALAALLGDVVRTARTRVTGELEITFDSGAALLVGADADFESWAIAGPDAQLMVCLAHGEVAVWGEPAGLSASSGRTPSRPAAPSGRGGR